MILSVWNQEWQRREMIDYLPVRLWFREALQEFLQHQSGAVDAARIQ